MNMCFLDGARSSNSNFAVHDGVNGERIYQHVSFSWASVAAFMSLSNRMCWMQEPPVVVPITICSSGWTTFMRLPSERRMRLF